MEHLVDFWILELTFWRTENKERYRTENLPREQILPQDLLKGLFVALCYLFQYWKNEKLDFFEMSIVPQTLNIKNYRTTSAKTISLVIIRKLIEYSFKNFSWTQYLLLPFLRYCCLKVGQEAKGLLLIYTNDLSDDLSSNVIYLLWWYAVFLIIMTKDLEYTSIWSYQ